MAKTNFIKKLKLSESYISMALGLIVVVVIGVLLFNFFSRQEQRVEEKVTEEATEIEETGEEEIKELPTSHTVAEGENLWKIAQKYFNSGYNWVDISKENKLANPNWIEVGMVLTIPKVEPIQPVATASVGPKIEGETYTVVRGDNLWNIALRAYGDGFAWVKIAQANNLVNPNLIHAGNVFIIPR